jgi:excisionase family DNA binding protein
MPDWITTADAANLSGYDVQYIRFLARTGKIGAEKKGRDWWIDRDKLRAYLATVEALGTKKFDPRGAIPQAKVQE